MRRNLMKIARFFADFTLKTVILVQFSTLSTRSTRKILKIITRRDFCVHVRVGRASNEFAS
jgi:hypothetical protein